MRATPPLWLNPPKVMLIPCNVLRKIDPQGLMVEVDVDGEKRSIVVREDAVRLKQGETFPATGNLVVVVVAELPGGDSRMLTELPATPFSGSQRIKVKPQSLLQPA